MGKFNSYQNANSFVKSVKFLGWFYFVGSGLDYKILVRYADA